MPRSVRIEGYDKFIEVPRRAARELQSDLEENLARAVLRHNPDDVEALRLLAESLCRQRRHTESLDVDRRIVELAPADPVSFYNLACSFAQLRQATLALRALRRAVRLGYRDHRHMLSDPDLKPLRDDPRFQKLAARLRSP